MKIHVCLSVPNFALVNRTSPCSHDLKHSKFRAIFPQLLHHPGKIQRQVSVFPGGHHSWSRKQRRENMPPLRTEKKKEAILKKSKTLNSKAEQMNNSHNTYNILEQSKVLTV